ncbi:hypothetical protein JCM30471_18940 [Desulfuromonas carbonis]|uniref:Ig domain-containing protein n=1 Tax=Desulfuromonas sp. DDH964 TaxID=1823759 RepID=UPI00078D596C|nr:Ig domain-containing protein [Desulfuromonas sp. DDH964]AMV73478.1 dystroglycan-type cadherin-like protein [Desulfuromonas sp. DDH964]
MRTLPHSLLIGSLVLVALQVGCERQAPPVPQDRPQKAAQEQVEPGAPRAAQDKAELQVSLLPAEATKKNDLRAVVSGAAGALSFRWEINGQEIEGNAGALLSNDLFHAGDQVSVMVRANGQKASSEVLIGNSPPEILEVNYGPSRVYRGVAIVARPEAVDLDGDAVTFEYRWLVNGEENFFPAGDTLPGDQFHKGDRIAVEVLPVDSEGEGQPYLTGEIVVGNAPPVFTSTPPESFRAALYSYPARAEDGDGDPLNYFLVTGPAGMTIDQKSGLVQWPIARDQGGENLVKIGVRDGDGLEAIQEFRLDIALQE